MEDEQNKNRRDRSSQVFVWNLFPFFLLRGLDDIADFIKCFTTNFISIAFMLFNSSERDVLDFPHRLKNPSPFQPYLESFP